MKKILFLFSFLLLGLAVFGQCENELVDPCTLPSVQPQLTHTYINCAGEQSSLSDIKDTVLCNTGFQDGSVIIQQNGCLQEDEEHFYYDQVKNHLAIGHNQTFDNYLSVGNRADTGSGGNIIIVNHEYDNNHSGNGHGFSDNTTWKAQTNTAYAAYEVRGKIEGANNYDHYVGYQFAPSFQNYSGNMRFSDAYNSQLVGPSTLDIDAFHHFRVKESISGTQILGEEVGLSIERMLATNAKAIKIYNGLPSEHLGLGGSTTDILFKMIAGSSSQGKRSRVVEYQLGSANAVYGYIDFQFVNGPQSDIVFGARRGSGGAASDKFKITGRGTIELVNQSALPPAPSTGAGICVVANTYYKWNGSAWVTF